MEKGDANAKQNPRVSLKKRIKQGVTIGFDGFALGAFRCLKELGVM